MNEIEQLRKELNELRERVAVLERRFVAPVYAPVVLPPAPTPMLSPPYHITCGQAQ